MGAGSFDYRCKERDFIRQEWTRERKRLQMGDIHDLLRTEAESPTALANRINEQLQMNMDKAQRELHVRKKELEIVRKELHDLRATMKRKMPYSEGEEPTVEQMLYRLDTLCFEVEGFDSFLVKRTENKPWQIYVNTVRKVETSHDQSVLDGLREYFKYLGGKHCENKAKSETILDILSGENREKTPLQRLEDLATLNDSDAWWASRLFKPTGQDEYEGVANTSWEAEHPPQPQFFLLTDAIEAAALAASAESVGKVVSILSDFPSEAERYGDDEVLIIVLPRP